LVFHLSTIAMMHGPINIRLTNWFQYFLYRQGQCCKWKEKQPPTLIIYLSPSLYI